jgi:hypothetical protein
MLNSVLSLTAGCAMANLPANSIIFVSFLVAVFLVLVGLFFYQFVDLMRNPHRRRPRLARPTTSDCVGLGGGGDAGACGSDGGGCSG